MLLDIPLEVFNLIIDNIDYKDTYNLLQTNSYFNKNYGNKNFIERYNHKIDLSKYLNQDYNRFHNLIKYVNKDYLHEIFKYSVSKINIVWMNCICGVYDLRFIFECMYNGCRIEDDLKLKSKHFYKHFYKHILKSIVENDRFKTQILIDNNNMLTSLHSQFVPIDNSNVTIEDRRAAWQWWQSLKTF